MPLNSAQLDELTKFENDLYAANEARNFTRVPQEAAEVRHFLDSILIAPLIPQGSRVLDIGSGPGFPAFPLAVVRPDLRIVAMDSSGKMLGFLEEHAPENLKVVDMRAEDFKDREVFDIVTGRAVAPLSIQLEMSAAPTKVGGAVIPFRTLQEKGDLAPKAAGELGLRLEEVKEVVLPGTDATRVFPVYRKVKATPPNFPRTWAQIKKRPL